MNEHLLYGGIKKNYTTWIWHDELTDMLRGSEIEPINVEMGDRLEDMICDLGQENLFNKHMLLCMIHWKMI